MCNAELLIFQIHAYMQPNDIARIIVPFIIMMNAYKMGHYGAGQAVTMAIILLGFINRPPFA